MIYKAKKLEAFGPSLALFPLHAPISTSMLSNLEGDTAQLFSILDTRDTILIYLTNKGFGTRVFYYRINHYLSNYSLCVKVKSSTKGRGDTHVN